MTSLYKKLSPQLSAGVERGQAKLWLRRVLFFVPGFYSKNLFSRICISVVVLIMFSLIIFNTFDKQFAFIKAAVQYDAYEHANKLYVDKNLAAADDFLELYENLSQEFPGIDFSEDMKQLQSTIKNARSSVQYQASELGRGLITGESSEYLGQTAALVTELFFIGDARDLGKEGLKYARGEKIDNVTVSLAAIGLCMSVVASWGPQVAASVPVKNALVILKQSAKSMNSKMLKCVNDMAVVSRKVLAITADKVKDSLSNAISSFRKAEFSSWWNKAPQVDASVALKSTAEMKSISSAFSALKTTGDLAMSDRKAAAFIVKHSDDFSSLEKNAIKAQKLGKRGGVMLETGGLETLKAVDQYSPSMIRQALAYGQNGVKSLVVTGSTAFVTKIRWMKMTYNGRLYYHFKNFLHVIPWPVSLGISIYLFMVFFKMWFLRNTQAPSA